MGLRGVRGEWYSVKIFLTGISQAVEESRKGLGEVSRQRGSIGVRRRITDQQRHNGLGCESRLRTDGTV